MIWIQRFFLILPGFAWGAKLNYTKIKLDLITDMDVYLMVEKGMRGSMTQASHEEIKANNKYMISCDCTKSSILIQYLDANNLYGPATTLLLPYKT